jgi:hypothetical protein
MSACLHQHIAGVDYLVSVPPGMNAAPVHAVRAEFVSHHRPALDGIRVELVVGELPDLSSWDVLLSSGPMWSIRQRGVERCLCLGDPRACPRMGWIACWPTDATHATVYCGPEYVTVRDQGLEMSNTAGYPVDQLLLIYYLARRQGLLVHAAGLLADGRALLFPGVSGAGKSTLARQFLAAGWASLLNDDRIIVRQIDGCHVAFGTPWPGDVGVTVNASAPLAAILFPARGAETRINELSPQAALDRLLPCTSILWHEKELLLSQLDACEHLLRDTTAFELSWSLANGVVEDVREFMRRL